MNSTFDVLPEGAVPLPASFAQERLWFLDRLRPGTSVYNMPVLLRTATPLDRNVLQRCLSELARRHETLRTSFAAHGGRPVQLVWPRMRAPLSFVDLRRFPPRERERRLSELASEQARRPFDLSRGPLLRAALYRLGAADHALLLVMHHIVSDAWSVELLVRELQALYTAFASGAPSPLSPLPIQYADWAQWQRERLAGDALDSELAFWRAFLDGAPTALELPADRPSPAQASYRGDLEPFLVEPGLTARLRALGQRHGATLYMVLLAAFGILLRRYGGQTDLLIGSPVSNRKSPDVESLLGLFVNTLVLRVRLDGDPTAAGLLERVRDMMLEVHAHDEIPLEKLIESLQPERSLGRHPLFQVLFSLQADSSRGLPSRAPAQAPAPVAAAADAGPPPATGTSKFDLSLLMADTPQGLAGTWEYAADLFDAPRIRRMTRHFTRLLAAMAERPEARVLDLSLADEDEERELPAFETGRRLSTEPGCVHEWIARQAERTPDAVALRAGGQELTYRELWSRGADLAGRLRALGVGPETRVGLCLRRGPDLLVGALGILAAGAAYVPLDPTHPKARLEHIIRDAGLHLVLTETALRAVLPSTAGARCLDEPGALGGERRAPRPVLPENPAYVLYTSGTTGRPKGVAVTHRSVTALLSWGLRTFSADELARVLASTSICFDISVFELFLPLVRGGTVVMVENALVLAEAGGGEGDAARDVTLINTVPSVLAELLRAWRPPEGLRAVNLAGEALPRDLVERLHRVAPQAKVHNLYGPTETTVYSTFAQIDPAEVSSPPIGRPLDGTIVHVLDHRLARVPVGVPGELYISGAGLARGYLGRPDLTAERYLPDPYSGEPGRRMYRTGDVASFRDDGTLQYHGRADHQVKLRGYRIELGEIESVLRAQPGIREAVVVVREDRGGNARLVAYATSDPPAPDAGELERGLRRALPPYMLPSRFIFLDALPRTATGKLDRRALPAPEWAGLAGPSRAPASDAEATLCRLFAEAVGVPEADPDADFFALGGHSLLAVGLVARIRELVGVELPLAAVFENSTPARLANAIAVATRAASPAPPGVRAARLAGQGPLPLSYTQESLWFFDRLQPGSALYNLPAMLRLDGEIDPALLQRCLDELVARHGALRTEIVTADGKPAQRVVEHAPVKLREHHLTDLPPDERRRRASRIAERESRRPFDLRRAPLFRATLIHLSRTEHLLVLVLHHIVGDGWSLGLIQDELGARYQALARGEAPSLPAPGTSYADYAVWQRGALAGPALEEMLAYFREQLAGAPPLLALPTDRPRPPRPSYRGDLISFEIAPDAAAALERLAGSRGATLFMALLAGFAEVLHRYSGQDQVVLGTAVANRDRREMRDVVGFFANTVPIRVDCGGDPSFAALLDRVRAAAMGAYARQELPFDRLVEDLQPERDLSYHPLFQSMFGFQDAGSPGADRSAQPVASPLATTATAKFDLSLTLSRAGGGLLGMLEYATDLFERSTVERFAADYRRAIESFAREPERPLGALALLDRGGERPRPSPPPADGLSLHRLVEQWAERAPGARAVVQGDRVLSYGELNQRANRLARLLRQGGVREGSTVAAYLDRSPEALVALLGAWKAGAACLPLAPGRASPEQVRQALAEARAAAAITRTELRAQLPFEGFTLALDGDPAGEGGGEDLGLSIGLDQPACIVEGHLFAHRALSLHAEDVARRFELGGADRVFVLAPPGSGAFLESAAAALSSGAALVLAGDPPPPPPELAAQAKRHGATVMYLPTETWSRAAGSLGSGGPEPRLVRLWGPPPSRSTLRRQLGAPGSRARLFRSYGRGAAALGAALHELTAADASEGHWRRLSAGRPLPHRHLYVLDPRGQPAPPGVPGLLFAGGGALLGTRAGSPERAADEHLPDPWSGVPAARLHRLGDLARLLPDGTLEVLEGVSPDERRRGLLVEPDQVAEAIRSHPAVEDAVVVRRPGATGAEAVAPQVAYVVPSAPLSRRDLELHLRSRLPGYLLPRDLVLLEALPLDRDGQVDVPALPAAAAPSEGARTGGGEAAPRTPTERAIARMWAEVLDHDRFGVEDSFFEVGGHSLAVIRVIASVLESFQVDLPLERFFTTPTIAAVSQVIDGALQAQAGAGGAPVLPLQRVDRSGSLPLSFAQERLWFLDQLEPGSPVYNIPHWISLDGTVDVPALERALERLAERHECLRARLPARDGRPELAVDPSLQIDLPVSDLSWLPAPACGREAARLASVEATRPFDLASGPLLRARLLRLSPRQSILLVTLHHVVGDAWSMDVLDRDLAALYEAEQTGVPESLPELEVQYADYAAWQRSWLQGERLESELAYWKQRLAGAPTFLPLPTDRPRPRKQSYQGGLLPLAMDAGVSGALRRLASEEQATPFMVLLALYGLVLSRWSGSEDLLVGTPVIGRPRRELEPLIGFFANTLVMRLDLGRDLTFRELVRQVRQTSIQAFAHQDMPFERLVEELHPDRALGHNPLFQVMFALQRPSEPSRAPPPLPASPGGAGPASVRPTTSKFDLTLFLVEDASFHGALEYRTDLFDGATIERFVEHLVGAARAVAEAPDRPLSSAWSAARPDLEALEHWNRTAAAFPAARLRAGALCEAQAARHPDRPAVWSRSQSLTYRQLWDRVRRLAGHLRARGVGPDARVGLCAAPSAELVVAALGILESGGACVPLDPGYPEERIRLMVRDSGVNLLVTSSTAPDVAPGLPRILVDGPLEPAREPSPEEAFSPDQLAYVVYTSGSTGTPKGVAMTHRALVNLVLWQLGLDGRGQPLRTLQFASPSFDVFFQELLLCAAGGGELVLPSQEERRDPARLRRFCREREIERIFLPFVALRELADAPEDEPPLARLREVITAGEQLQITPSLRRWFSAHPGCRLYNQYGPSETHVVSEETLGADPERWEDLPPIGRPIANDRMYVLDELLRPQPIGVPGDLYLGGVGLARGYLDRPELTAARFLPDPFSPEPGARMYASGDRARWQRDGKVEFLGRNDTQTKIRGYRVELGEVEAALSRLPGVSQAVAAALPDARGDRRLVGYVLSAEGGRLDLPSLRDALRRALPDPMVPSVLVQVDHFPRTPSGKVDRRALPAPARESAPAGAHEPRSEVERTIAGVWREVLGLDRCGVDDDFFELGGHSLLATQVVARLRDAFGVELPVSLVFEHCTVARLAPAVVAALLAQEGGPDPSELESVELLAGAPQGALHG